MKLDKDNYTKQEVEDLLKNLNKQVADVTTQLTTAQEQVKELNQLKKDNLHNSIKLEMTKAGIDEGLFDLVVSDDLETAKGKITKLQDIAKRNKVDNSYKPDNHKADDSYAEAEKAGNTEGMIKSKFAKLFQ